MSSLLSSPGFQWLCAIAGEFVILVTLTIAGIYVALFLLFLAVIPFTKASSDEFNGRR